MTTIPKCNAVRTFLFRFMFKFVGFFFCFLAKKIFKPSSTCTGFSASRLVMEDAVEDAGVAWGVGVAVETVATLDFLCREIASGTCGRIILRNSAKSTLQSQFLKSSAARLNSAPEKKA